MAIRDVLYAHVEIWVWVLCALVVGMAGAVMWVLRSRDVIASELSVARSDLGYTRAELRRLDEQWARARTPAKTVVLPALLPCDPEEFKKTQLRRVR